MGCTSALRLCVSPARMLIHQFFLVHARLRVRHLSTRGVCVCGVHMPVCVVSLWVRANPTVRMCADCRPRQQRRSDLAPSNLKDNLSLPQWTHTASCPRPPSSCRAPHGSVVQKRVPNHGFHSGRELLGKNKTSRPAERARRCESQPRPPELVECAVLSTEPRRSLPKTSDHHHHSSHQEG